MERCLYPYRLPAVVVAILVAVFGTLGLLWLRRTPYDRLMDAIDRRDASAVRRELESGTDPNWLPPDYDEAMLPLVAAASDGDLEIAGLLLDHGAKVDDYDGWATPLVAAAERNHVPMMELLVARGATVNDGENGGSWSLWRVALGGYVEPVRCLLARGANPNTTFNGEKLIDAVRSFDQDAVASVLEAAGAK